MLQDAPPQPTQLVTAFAVVIEASLEIAQEWPTPLFNYFTHIVRRVSDGHPGKLSIAFVGYGTADTVPSPILCKRFFSDNRMVYKELFDDPLHFGIGKTRSGGGSGMAALEGLISALEMFDALHNLPNTKVLASYVLHIAANPPDNSRRPLWNESSIMDDMNWESLSQEFKNRNVSYNLLTLKSPPGKLSYLYTSVNGDAESSPLWFELPPPHTLLAFAINSLSPIKAPVTSPIKRPSEVADNKRSRMQHPAVSPKLGANLPVPALPPRSSQSPSPSPSPSPPPSQPSAQLQPQPHSQPLEFVPAVTPPVQRPPQASKVAAQRFVGGVNLKEAEDRIQMAEESLKRHLMAIERVQEEGNLERAATMQKEYHDKRVHVERMKNVLNQYKQQMQESPGWLLKTQQQDPSTSSKTEVIGSPFVLNNLSTASSTVTTAHQATGSEQPQSQLNFSITNPSGTQVPLNTPLSNMINPVANAQVSRMAEQTQVTHLPLGMGIQNYNSNVPPGPAGHFSASGIDVSGMNSMGGASSNPRQQLRWAGILMWFAEGCIQETKCVVNFANAVVAHKAHVNTWPTNMRLQPAGRFSAPHLPEWARKSQACLCAFQPASPDADQIYQKLLDFLAIKRMIATAAWPNPSGNTTQNIVFFPHMQPGMRVLAAAVSPLTGFTDLPVQAMPQIGLHQTVPEVSSTILPPLIANSLAPLPPAERQQMLARYILSQGGKLPPHLQQQPLSNQTILGSSSFPQGIAMPPGPNINMVSGLNMMSTQSQGSSMMNMTPPSGTLGNAVGGQMPMNLMQHNVNPDVFNSFLQRNAGNMEQNMGQNP